MVWFAALWRKVTSRSPSPAVAMAPDKLYSSRLPPPAWDHCGPGSNPLLRGVGMNPLLPAAAAPPCPMYTPVEVFAADARPPSPSASAQRSRASPARRCVRLASPPLHPQVLFAAVDAVPTAGAGGSLPGNTFGF